MIGKRIDDSMHRLVDEFTNDRGSESGLRRNVNVVVPNGLLMFVQSLLTTYTTCRAFSSKRGRSIPDCVTLPPNDTIDDHPFDP